LSRWGFERIRLNRLIWHPLRRFWGRFRLVHRLCRFARRARLWTPCGRRWSRRAWSHRSSRSSSSTHSPRHHPFHHTPYIHTRSIPRLTCSAVI
jgi:hypothetical protein